MDAGLDAACPGIATVSSVNVPVSELPVAKPSTGIGHAGIVSMVLCGFKLFGFLMSGFSFLIGFLTR